MWSFPVELEEALWDAARALLPEGALTPNALQAGIVERTRRYTSERERLCAPLPPRERARDLAARALFFTVADAAKIGIPVAELASRGLLRSGAGAGESAPLSVLDLGAGCGAMTLGLAAALPGRTLDVTALDRDEPALALLGRAAAAVPGLTVRTRVADVTAPLPPATALHEGHDLIVAGTVLNELPAAARAPLVRRLVETALAPGGALIVIEPALRETARALHEVRDALLAAGGMHVFAPCTRTSAPCPALADPRDWCHEDRPFRPPPRLAQLVRATGLRREGLKFAYLTLRRAADPLAVVAPAGRALRVVSDALDQKGTFERIVCNDEGRVHLRLLRRDRGPATDALSESRRGDVIVRDDQGRLDLLRPAPGALR